MRSVVLVVCCLFATMAWAQGASVKADPFAPLLFLQGTWEARAQRPDGVAVNGRYAFGTDLKGTVLVRRNLGQSSCEGPASFNCNHGDLLYVYRDLPGGPLKAIYFDDEGHVIHYAVATPSATSVQLLSDASQPGPQFRLTYELKGDVMFGRFQIRMPGQEVWRSYLEWSGGHVGAAP